MLVRLTCAGPASHQRRSTVLKLLLALSAALLLAASCSGAFVEILGQNFGTVRPGYAETRTFFVRNGGGVEARLGEVSDSSLGLSPPFALAGGSCTSGHVIPAGGWCELAITFSPTAEGLASERIQLTNSWTDSEDGLSRTAVAVLDISGIGGDGVTISGGPLHDFGGWAPGARSYMRFLITNSGSPAIVLGDIDQASLGLDAPFLLSSVGSCTTGLTLQPQGESCILEVIFEPDSVGTFADTLTVEYAPVGSTERRSLSLELRGVGASVSMTASTPDGDAYGVVPVGSSKTKTYTVRNEGNVDVTFARAVLLRAPFSFTGTTCPEFTVMPPGATCTIDVTFAPSDLGLYTERMMIGYTRTGQLNDVQFITIVLTGGE